MPQSARARPYPTLRESKTATPAATLPPSLTWRYAAKRQAPIVAGRPRPHPDAWTGAIRRLETTMQVCQPRAIASTTVATRWIRWLDGPDSGRGAESAGIHLPLQ